MLEIDGKDQGKGLKDRFPEFFKPFENIKDPLVTFRLLDKYHNKKDVAPRSFTLPDNCVIIDDDGNITKYVYYKTKREQTIGKRTEMIYSPGSVGFSSRGDILVDIKKEIDLFIFLMICNRRAGSASADGKNFYYYLEDKYEEARIEVSKKIAKVKMESYLYGDNRLSDENIRTIAQSLRVYGVNQHTDISYVCLEIGNTVKNNPERFLKLVEVGNDVVMGSNLQKAAEQGIISFKVTGAGNDRRRAWILNDSDSGNSVELMRVSGTEDEMVALSYWLREVDLNRHYERILHLVKDKTVKPKKAEIHEIRSLLRSHSIKFSQKLKTQELISLRDENFDFKDDSWVIKEAVS